MPMLSTLKRFAAPLGLGAFACAICCALPVVGLLLGAGVASSVAVVLEPVAAVVLALAAVGAVVIAVFTWRASRRSASSCEADGSCGCGPTDEALREADVSVAVDAGCTLAPVAMPDRKGAFQRLLSSSMLRREAHPDRLEWRLVWSAAVERQARALAAAESQCCSFFVFDLARDGDELRWTTRTTPGREASLGMLDRLAREVARA